MKLFSIAEFAGLVASVATLHVDPTSAPQESGFFAQAGQPASQPPRQNPGSPTTNPRTPQQPGTTPAQTNPNQPNQTQPNQTPGNINPGSPTTNPSTAPLPTNPNGTNTTTNPDGTTVTNPNGTINPNGTVTRNGTVLPSTGLSQRELALRRLFALDNPESQARVTELGQKLTRLESQFNETNQRLLKQLGQARMMQGDRRVDAMAQVFQDLLQQQAALQQYLVDLRTSITGDLALNDAATGTQPGQNPTFNPGGTQNPRLNPSDPTTNPATPRTSPTPSGTPGTVPGDARQNPGSPTTNPSTPAGPATPTGTPR